MSQKAAVYVNKHEYPVIQERPIPTPEGSDVLVKVTAVGLNPVEWKIIEYGLYGEPPAILGYDVVGVIEEVGPDVKNYKKGDRIVTWATRKDHDHSGLQQYALVGTTPNTIAKLPENIADDQGATLPTAINTATVALYDKDGLGFPSPFDGGSTFGNGKSFLVSGGSSVIGLAAIRFLHLSGFTTIITTAAKRHESLVKKFGATHVIDRTLPIDDQVAEIKSIAPSLQHAWDAIGSKETNRLVARSFGSQGGQFVASLQVDTETLSEHKNVSGKGIYGSPLDNHVESATKVWTHLEEALKKGDLLPTPHKVWGGLSVTAEALKAVKKASGYKVIVHPQE